MRRLPYVSTFVNLWHTGGMTTTMPVLAREFAACCAPVTGGVLSGEDAQRLARVFKALGDPARVRLLSLIAAADGGEACLCDLTAPVGLSQPTVSHHMRQLTDAGLVTREQRGKWAYYRVVPLMLSAVARAIAPADLALAVS
jgi:ArsR family transcriptional regulator, arsenate/arsenite/antimonite-responsive transcriptional repressor